MPAEELVRLATTSKCYVDTSDGTSYCVLDDDNPDNCDEAAGLSARGLCKEDCPHWRDPEAVAFQNERLFSEQRVRAIVRIEADERRSEVTRSQLRLDAQMATTAPVFRDSTGFGIGTYTRNSDLTTKL